MRAMKIEIERVHAMQNRSSVCTAGTNWLVHTPKRDRKRFTRSDLLGPSATRLCLALPHVCGNDDQRARRRSLCSRCSPLVSVPRMPAFSHAPEHVMLMLCSSSHVLGCVLAQMCNEDSDWQVWRRIKGCNVLQGRMDTGCACAGREKRAQRPCVERERSSHDLSHRYGHAV